ncbi:MAG TPA: DNA polymerase III subunit delta [Candidatus Acidoferrum sp.]|nr:DNA polymerase III subunit delta [Candidatus Acidoferrum sp.]
MARISTRELAARLEKDKKISAILLLGDEPYLRDKCRVVLIDHFVQEAARAWAVSRFSADCGETQAALDQAQTLPMLSSKQVVFLEDAEAIEALGEKNRKETVESILAYLNDPAPFTVLVLEAAKLDMRMQLGKNLAEETLVVEVGTSDDAGARVASATVIASDLARQKGIELEKGAAEELAELVSGDLLRLETELEKLVTFAASRKKITKAEVAALVISEKTTTIWEVAGFLAAQQPKAALEFINRLFREGEPALLMLGGITWMYRKIVEASELRSASNGWQAARALGMRPEQAESALECSRKISKERLMNGIRALKNADVQLKSGRDERTVMEFLVWELSGAKSPARY